MPQLAQVWVVCGGMEVPQLLQNLLPNGLTVRQLRQVIPFIRCRVSLSQRECGDSG